MPRALKIIGVVLGGAAFGAVGLSLLVFALLWMLMPKMMSNPLGYQMLIVIFTVPVGALCGAMLAVGMFHERDS